MRSAFATGALAFCLVFVLGAGSAGVARAADEGSSAAMGHATRISQACPGHWEDQNCLARLSESTLVLASTYMQQLQESGKGSSYVESVKQHCAAATAASRIEVPAYAMQSAMTECANTIYDVSQATSLRPDQSQYQLLVYPIACLGKEQGCGPFEQALLELRNKQK